MQLWQHLWPGTIDAVTLTGHRLARAPARLRLRAPQKLRTSAGTILTLDGRRITSHGIVSGASFRVVPLEQADVRFGSGGAVGEVRAAAQGRVAKRGSSLCLVCRPPCLRELVSLVGASGVRHTRPAHTQPSRFVQDPAAAAAAEQVAALEEWVQLLRSRDQADAAATEAQVCCLPGRSGQQGNEVLAPKC